MPAPDRVTPPAPERVTPPAPERVAPPAPNRVTPLGEIVAIEQRGLFLGNRGCIHRAPREIARPWQVRRWITCRLEYKGWVAPKWEPRRWTPLFFWDEAVALAAGHRPCALCRRPDFDRWLDAWESAFGERPRVDPMDRRLHHDRSAGRASGSGPVPGSGPGSGPSESGSESGSGGEQERHRRGHVQRRHVRPWPELPVGTYALLDDEPCMVLPDRVVPWSPAGHGSPQPRPPSGDATVLTPACTVEVLLHGYVPVVHPSAVG